jgi:hypothetical protein
MRNFLAFIGLLLVVFVGVGLYKGWFKFSMDSDKNVNISVNGEKAIKDTKEITGAGIEKTKEIVGNLKKDQDGNSPTPAMTAGPTGK